MQLFSSKIGYTHKKNQTFMGESLIFRQFSLEAVTPRILMHLCMPDTDKPGKQPKENKLT